MSKLGNNAREKFGSWIKGRLQPVDLPAAPVLPKALVRVVDEGKSSPRASILLGQPAPIRQSPDFFPLTLANLILGGLGKGSRLEQAFAKRNIPYQAVGSELRLGQTCGWFQVSAQVPIRALPAAFAGMLESIEGLKASPPSEDELRQAKSALVSSHSASLESETGLASQLTAVELFDLPRDFLSSFPLRVDQVSAERVQEAAKNHFSSTRIAGVIVGDGQAVRDGVAEFRTLEISEWREPAKEPTAH
jgi:zinc protease